MGWEVDTTTYKDINTHRVQEVIKLLNSDPKLVETARMDPVKALVPDKLNPLEIKNVADYFKR
jgi:hypothetical protein